ncbi:MAG: M67 family metallopeptidase [Rhodospirillales bacterium]|nr:M67 family metallopeptidase [Rhodospirillales bacterium]
MIIVPGAVVEEIAAAAEAAYPEECCGLLIGRTDNEDSASDRIRVTRAVASRNVATEPRRDRFEVDPAVRFALMRELGEGPERIVGHYHSHPDHPAEPSARDAEMAFEPDLVWVIVSVAGGRVVDMRAHRPEPGGHRFRPVTFDASWRGPQSHAS